jgi:DNA-binding response OmpR family regulator
MTAADSSAPSGRFRLLMIDDDRKLCRLVGDYLGPLGFELTAVHDGAAGAERATQPGWDGVILDVMLPGLDGFEVLRRIRRTSDVPVLMLTARGDETDRIVGLEVGADDYLPKTFSTRELLARLRAVLRRSTRPVAGNARGRPLAGATRGALGAARQPAAGAHPGGVRPVGQPGQSLRPGALARGAPR